MQYSLPVRAGAAGLAVGGTVAGALWWVNAPLVLVAATGAVWTVALGVSLYVFDTYGGSDDAGPWGTVVGGSLLFSVVVNLSGISIPNEVTAALTTLVIGFTLLAYAAGIATASRRDDTDRSREEYPADS